MESDAQSGHRRKLAPMRPASASLEEAPVRRALSGLLAEDAHVRLT